MHSALGRVKENSVYADADPHTDWCAYEAENPDAASVIDDKFVADGDSSALMDAMTTVADALQRTRMRRAVEDENFKHAWDIAARWRCKINKHRAAGMANPPAVLPVRVAQSNGLGADAMRQERLQHFGTGYGADDAEGKGECGGKEYDEQWSGAEF